MTSPSKDTVRVGLADWMREPDHTENASIEWLLDWVNRRPIDSALAHDEMVKALESAPRPKPFVDPGEYMDWYFKVRTATLSRLKTEG